MALAALSDVVIRASAVLTGSFVSSTTVALKEDGTNVVGGISPAATGVLLDITFTAVTSLMDLLVQVSDDGGTTWRIDPAYSLANQAASFTRTIIVRPILPHETDLRVRVRDTGAGAGTMAITARLMDMRKVTS